MNDYWHIPRASLAPSSNTASSAVSSISSSNRSNRSDGVPLPNTAQQQHQNLIVMTTPAMDSSNKSGSSGKRTKRQPQYSNKTTAPNTPRPSSSVAATTTTSTTTAAAGAPNTNPAITAAAAAAVLAAAAVKRGSRSSQGSSDSNNSTRSAASGSLLLTAANLERFAEIQKKQHKGKELVSVHQQQHHHHHQHHGHHQLAPQQYNANLLHATKQQQLQVYTVTHPASSTDGAQRDGNGDAIITMDPNLNFIKTKDLDTVSIASSMHFTMVNGDVGQSKKPKRGLCDRGRQVTVLIVSMSTIFLLLIMGMVYALEMRAREMPQS